jgi:uncharacterized OB-fold protein
MNTDLAPGTAENAPYNKPLPKLDALTRPFWAEARNHRLVMQVCERCNDMHFPPSPICPNCLSEEQSWQEVSGRGMLMSWVVFHRAYWNGFMNELPYAACLVQLEEGPMLVSNLVDGKAREIAVGMPVRVVFETATNEITIPKFTPD